MPVTITRLPNEPIVIVELRERMDLNSVRTMFKQTAEIARDMNQPVYRIANFLNVNVSIREMAAALAEGTKGGPGSPRDRQVPFVMVAGRNRIRFFFEMLRRKEYGGIEVPVFDTMDEALAYVRAQLGNPTAANV